VNQKKITMDARHECYIMLVIVMTGIVRNVSVIIWTSYQDRTLIIRHFISHQDGLNITPEWLACLLHIWEVPGSNLSLETSYPDSFLMVFQ
jgi:hypothetical protein